MVIQISLILKQTRQLLLEVDLIVHLPDLMARWSHKKRGFSPRTTIKFRDIIKIDRTPPPPPLKVPKKEKHHLLPSHHILILHSFSKHTPLHLPPKWGKFHQEDQNALDPLPRTRGRNRSTKVLPRISRKDLSLQTLLLLGRSSGDRSLVSRMECTIILC